MPWIEYDADRRQDFNRIESDLMRSTHATSSTGERTPRVPGKTEKMVTPELAQLLTEREFSFSYL